MADISKVTQLSWRRFIATEAGKEGIDAWKNSVPPVPTGEPHAIIFAAGVSQGYRDALNYLVEVIGGAPEKRVPLEPEDKMER